LTGGAGYLCAYSYQDGKYTQLHELSIAVRDFLWFREERMVFINQGLHGIAAYTYNTDGFVKVGGFKPDHPVHQMSISPDMRYCAVSRPRAPVLSVFSIHLP
ncbi:MAG: hypothetical protein GY757_26325, partial [bacterium]|nr:hypothetical protein [bacterium]